MSYTRFYFAPASSFTLSTSSLGKHIRSSCFRIQAKKDIFTYIT